MSRFPIIFGHNKIFISLEEEEKHLPLLHYFLGTLTWELARGALERLQGEFAFLPAAPFASSPESTANAVQILERP